MPEFLNVFRFPRLNAAGRATIDIALDLLLTEKDAEGQPFLLETRKRLMPSNLDEALEQAKEICGGHLVVLYQGVGMRSAKGIVAKNC